MMSSALGFMVRKKISQVMIDEYELILNKFQFEIFKKT